MLEDATVLVYTADTDRGTAYYAAACLGCTYRKDQNASHTPMPQAETATAANAHAATRRAMPRGVPAQRGDTEAADLIHARLWNHRYGTTPRPVHLADFHVLRVDLQRSTD
ncbi:hypothetical protein [Streptomyces sp. KN37]|uniref:hypothetical protein n=1 Tax=Streptomyces sp. KN37 TaxID=3090667 RepID=UPI002A74F3E3|nr:hypothetical protein [Streptomyces sp. KN37]WPO76736.1 hypothetical protein R9806_39640 [Streptomyces sp. KN37]